MNELDPLSVSKEIKKKVYNLLALADSIPYDLQELTAKRILEYLKNVDHIYELILREIETN